MNIFGVYWIASVVWAIYWRWLECDKGDTAKLKFLMNFIEESLPRESGIPLLKSKEAHSSCVKLTIKNSPVNTKLNSCENPIKFTDIPTRKR